jgi:hypothetical protein
MVGSGLLMQWREDAHSHALERGRKVVHDVPSICDLYGVRSTARGSASVDTSPVATDHLDTGMLIQPVDQRVGGGILEQVDHAMGVSVNQNRAVATATAEGELVYAQLAWRRSGRLV